MRALDLAWKVFGRLSVVARVGQSNDGKITWLCRCSCGVEIVLVGASIKRGNVKSCGCLRREVTSARRRAGTVHGMCRAAKRSSEWTAWQSMLARCENPNLKPYPRYGGRGVTVHPLWHDFEPFFAHVGRRPTPQHSLDRFPNPDGNYEPGNVRWATWNEQNRNKSCVKLSAPAADQIRNLACSGTATAQLAELFGVSKSTIKDVVADRIWRRDDGAATQAPVPALPRARSRRSARP